ncbi:O-acyltransferase like protein-like isoform X2 [Thrips palmi]|nr:O-acyltransferase like protein-like isoform X2 [Thrips palmi]
MWFHWPSVVAVSATLFAIFGGASGDISDQHHDRVDAAVGKFIASVRHPDTLGPLVRAASAASAYDNACSRSLGQWASGLRSAQGWALRMVDSSAKLVTGVLYGNAADLGNFDECVRASSPDGFSGRYILPYLDVQTAPNISTLVTGRIAFCVPSTCDEQLLEETLSQALKYINAGLAAIGFRVQCRLPRQASAVAGLWRTPAAGDYVVIVICLILAMLVAIGTAIDLRLSEKEKRVMGKASLVLAFSAWTNGRRLFAIAPPSDSNFTCINGIRFMSAVWVVLGHRYLGLTRLPCMNLLAVPERFADLSGTMLYAAPLSVDTFFCIGGLVNCYVFMKVAHDSGSFNIFMYYFHRYIRLTPAFALMVAITATWISLLGDGPLWADIVDGASETCRQHWWTALLYVANYANPDDQCMMQSWYLMADMQLHWVSPLLLYPLWRWRRYGVVWLCVVLAASCAWPFGLTFANNLPSPLPLSLSLDGQAWFMQHMYYSAYSRAASYICGTLAGFVLFLIKSGSINRKLTKNEVRLGWLLSTALCLAVVLGQKPLVDFTHYPYNVWRSSLFAGLHRPAWCLGISWVVLACILGHGGPVNSLLSWAPFTILGRLTYGIYLTHAAVQAVDHGTTRTSMYYSDFKMVEKMLSDVVLSSILGACLCLALESPISSIEKSLRTVRGRQHSSNVTSKELGNPDQQSCA